MQLRVLRADDVTACLPLARAIDAMADAFARLSAGDASVPLRGRLQTDSGVTLLMPAHLPDAGGTCVKLVSIYPGNAGRGMPVVTGLAVAIDPESGQPTALIETESLTAIRSAAAGGLAARLLSREDAAVATIFGGGVQAHGQLDALCLVRAIRQVFVCTRSRETAVQFVDQAKARHPNVTFEPADSKQDAVREADVVICATTSHTPVFDGSDLQPGTHVTGVGSYSADMQEIDTTAVNLARVYVDSRTACLAEAGDLIAAEPQIVGEIGEVVLGRVPGRNSDADITLFKSVGVAVQDAVAAKLALRAAAETGRGTIIEL